MPKSRKGGGVGFLWFVAILMLGVVGWIFWQSGRATTPKSASTSTTANPPTKRVAVRTNVVVSTNLIAPTPKPAVSPTRTNLPPVISKAVTTNQAPVIQSNDFPRPARDVLEAQIALARLGISPGSIDGVTGSQTAAALKAFQQQKNLPASGQLDAETKSQLLMNVSATLTYLVTSNDLARLQPVSQTWLGKSQQTALDYETILELVAERGRASPNLIRRLNPKVDWTNMVAGAEIKIPEVTNAVPSAKAAFATISLAEKKLQVFDADTNLLAHFPCSIAQRVEKRPVGELRIKAVAPNPDYTFNPEVFPESAEARQIKTKLILPPGPNNPVGTAWVSLDKPGYGIHGTPKPEDVGRTESHGCFRLANWNAEFFLKLAWVGMPVYVEP